MTEVQFASNRFVTYRGYKFDFTGVPTEPIAVHAAAFGENKASSTTVVHVSWNGATEVAVWRVQTAAGSAIAEASKTGFETAIHVRGWYAEVAVVALAMNGTEYTRLTTIPLSQRKVY